MSLVCHMRLNLSGVFVTCRLQSMSRLQIHQNFSVSLVYVARIWTKTSKNGFKRWNRFFLTVNEFYETFTIYSVGLKIIIFCLASIYHKVLMKKFHFFKEVFLELSMRKKFQFCVPLMLSNIEEIVIKFLSF